MASTTSTTTTLRLGGVVSGIDTETIIQKILAVERIPENHLLAQKTINNVKSDAITAIKNSLTSLKSAISSLQDSAFFSSKTATTSDATVATASATSSAISNSYHVKVTSLATATVLRSGKSGARADLRVSNDVAGGSSMGDNFPILTEGTFTVNGTNITVSAGQTLTDLLTDLTHGIMSATGVTAVTLADDTIKIDGSQPIVLGSATDTSNFLTIAHLYSNGTASTTSLSSLGTVNTTQVLNTSGSRIIGATTAFAEDASFKINGVDISVNSTTDTLQSVLERISNSEAGVYASYDAYDDRVVLTSKSTGSIGISVTGNDLTHDSFADVLKLTSDKSTTTTGTNTEVDISGIGVRRSTDNVITEEESGITGLTITALNEYTTGDGITINVGADNATIQKAVSSFVDQYNSLQNIISSYTNTPTKETEPDDPKSILAGDSTVSDLAHNLRSTVMAGRDTGTIRMLEDIGVSSSGDNNLLTFGSPSALTSALALHPSEVISLFTDSTYGIMNQLGDFISAETDATSGSLTASLEGITKTNTAIDESIVAMEARIASEEQRLVESFANMEQYLAQNQNILNVLGISNSSSK